jgi:hypothetical protein
LTANLQNPPLLARDSTTAADRCSTFSLPRPGIGTKHAYSPPTVTERPQFGGPSLSPQLGLFKPALRSCFTTNVHHTRRTAAAPRPPLLPPPPPPHPRRPPHPLLRSIAPFTRWRRRARTLRPRRPQWTSSAEDTASRFPVRSSRVHTSRLPAASALVRRVHPLSRRLITTTNHVRPVRSSMLC